MADNNTNEEKFFDWMDKWYEQFLKNNPSYNKDYNDFRHWFGDRRHFRPWYDDNADYNTNAKSYYDYLGLRVKQLNEALKQVNKALARDLLVKNTPTVTMKKTGNWQSQDDVITLESLVNVSKQALNAVQSLNDGIYVKNLQPDIDQLKSEISKLKLTTNTPKYLKINGFNIDFADDFTKRLDPLLVYHQMSPMDFKYLTMQSPTVGSMQWATAYKAENFSCIRQGRTVTLNAYVHTGKIAPDVKEYLFVDLVQNWAKPIHQTAFAASWSNASVTEDVPVHGYVRTDGIINVTTGSYRQEWNGGYLEFGLTYQARQEV